MADFGGDSFVLFLSTPSARRATGALTRPLDFLRISIHALREEGDLSLITFCLRHEISIHALREEGDMVTIDA